MKVLKMTVMAAVLTMALSAGPAFAQAAPPVQNPPAQPPATPPAQTPAAPAAVPKPFPQGSQIALINLQAIASNSVEGKAATAKIQELQKKKTAELAEKNK